MKYCIGCQHLDFTPADPGTMGSTWTGIYGESDAEMFCALKHWQLEIDRDTGVLDIEKAMRRAETCPDFLERASPDSSGGQT